MGSELIAHEGERDNCFSKIQLVGQKYWDKTNLASKTRFSCQGRHFSLLVGYNIWLSGSSTKSERSIYNAIDH